MNSCDQMSLVMFIDQYLKRSANLFAENITASPFKGLISDPFAQKNQNCFFDIHIMLRHIPTYICLETVRFVSFNVK